MIQQKGARRPLRVVQKELRFFPQSAPIPEPPRVINTRPTVPDLSVSSEASVSVSYKHFVQRRNQQPNALKEYRNPVQKHPPVNYLESLHQRFNTKFPNYYPGITDNLHESTKNRQSRPTLTKSSKDLLPSKFSPRKDLTDKEVRDALRGQDAQLQLISEQVEKLLKISQQLTAQHQQIQLVQKKPIMRTVETMTSIVLTPKEFNRRHISRRSSPISAKGSPKLSSIDELSAESFESRQSSIERRRSFEGHEEVYDRMLNNINSILEASKSSDEDYTRGSISPVVERKAVHRKTTKKSCHSQETIIIQRLAQKYKIMSDDISPKKHVNVYGLANSQTSIATKNYLRKYGLTNQTSNKCVDQVKKTKKINRPILNIEKLKQQPKFK